MKAHTAISRSLLALCGGILFSICTYSLLFASSTGTIKVPWDRFEILYTTNRRNYQTAVGRGGVCKVPAGTYTIYRVTLAAADDNDTDWQMNCEVRKTLTVEADETVSLEITPPFTAKVTPSKLRVRPGERIRFNLEITDAKGVSCGVPRPTRGSGETPRLNLTDEDGRIVGKYAFEYG
jgi:hypothetical protein